MGEPRRHHYLPQAYLRGFSRNERGVWVYDIQTKRTSGRTIGDTGVIADFNALESGDGTRDLTVEKFLASLEGDFACVMKDKVEPRKELSLEDRTIIALFAAFQKLRTPEFQQDTDKSSAHLIRKSGHLMVATEERAEESVRQYEEATGKPLGLTAKELRDFLLSDEYEISISRNHSLLMMTQLAPKFAEMFVQMEWLFLCAPGEKSFVTTDSPFVVQPPVDWPSRAFGSGASIGIRGARKVLPLSQSTCLVMCDYGVACGYQNLEAEQVRPMNLTLASLAFRNVIARDEKLLESIVREIERKTNRLGNTWGGSKLTIS